MFPPCIPAPRSSFCYLLQTYSGIGVQLPYTKGIMKRLLTYPEVKHIFGWKDTSTVRRYVQSGDLVRVHLGNGMNTYRITEESALAFIERLKSKYEQESYAERAAKHTARMRKALPEPEPEVMLDSEEIIRQSRLTAPEPTPRQTLDDALANRDAAQGQLPRPARPAGLGFRTMRGI